MVIRTHKTPQFLDLRASRGFVPETHYSHAARSGYSIEDHPVSYDLLEMMWRYDPIIARAFRVVKNRILDNGYNFYPVNKNKAQIKTQRNTLSQAFFELDVDFILENVCQTFQIYDLCFIEKVRNDAGKVVELNVLETKEMYIEYNEHGEIKGFWQNPVLKTASRSPNKPANAQEWDVDDVILLRKNITGSRVYPNPTLEPIAQTWSISHTAHNYLEGIFRNLKPELFIHLAGANEKERNAFVEMLYNARSNPGIIPTSYSNNEQSKMQFAQVEQSFNNGLLSVLEYLREQVLLITGVPPTSVGIHNNEGGNARNSESQMTELDKEISSLQRTIAHAFNKQLLPDIVLGTNWRMQFHPSSARTVNEAIKNANLLRSMAVKPEAISDFLRRHGIMDVDPDDFMDVDGSLGNQATRNAVSPSRQPSDGTSSDLDEAGTSDAGGAKLAEQRSKAV